MRAYIAIVHKDKDSAYGAHFPDLKGCFTAADKEDDLVPNAVQALSFYAETEDDMPEPRSVAELMEDREVRKSLAEGGALFRVPLIIETKKERVNVMLPVDLVSAIGSIAEAAGISRSEFIAAALRREIGGTVAIASRPEKRGPKARL